MNPHIEHRDSKLMRWSFFGVFRFQPMAIVYGFGVFLVINGRCYIKPRKGDFYCNSFCI
jgi:hypothetical protein